MKRKGAVLLMLLIVTLTLACALPVLMATPIEPPIPPFEGVESIAAGWVVLSIATVTLGAGVLVTIVHPPTPPYRTVGFARALDLNSKTSPNPENDMRLNSGYSQDLRMVRTAVTAIQSIADPTF